jgi:hypothetical protein
MASSFRRRRPLGLYRTVNQRTQRVHRQPIANKCAQGTPCCQNNSIPRLPRTPWTYSALRTTESNNNKKRLENYS